MEAQREHGAITDEKARNVVALYFMSSFRL